MLLRNTIAAALLLIAPLWAAAVRAQEPAPAAEPAAAPETTPADADGPDVYLLPDEAGRLRRVLGYRYEDFLRAWEAGIAGRGQAVRPPLAISKLTLEADAADATAKVRAEIALTLQAEGWVEAPLQLGSIVVGEMKIEGGEKGEYLSVDATRNAYVAWLKGTPGDERTIVIEGHAAIARDGESRRLELQLPSAAASTVRLTTPEGEVTVESPDDALLRTEPAAESGRSTTIVEGARGRFAVRWGPKQSTDAPRFATLEATADSIVDVSPGGVNYEAWFRIDAFDVPLDRVRIRLPAGATASTTLHAAEYEVVSLGSGSVGEGPGDNRAVVEIRFHEPTANPPLIRLTAEQAAGAAAESRFVEVGAFEVIGAFRQHGAVAIRVNDQLYAHFEREGPIERIAPDELPEAMESEGVAAAFEAADADWRVNVHVQPRERRVRVTPQFALHLGAQGATLDTVLDYQLTGGRTFELRVNLAGWALSEQLIESGGAVDLAQHHVTADGVLVLPLKDSAAEQVRVRLALRREAGLGANDLPLPVVLEALVLPGALTVTADETWRATPDFENSSGVAPAGESSVGLGANGDAAAAAPAASSRQLAPLRLTTTSPSARLAVEVEKRERQITASSLITVEVGEQSVHVDQRLAFDIRNQPAEEVAATVTSDLLANEELELLVDGKAAASSVDIQPITSSADADDNARLRLVVRLPRPTLGRVELAIRSVHALDETQRTGAAMVALPLAAPDQAGVSTVEVVSTGPWRAALWPSGELQSWKSESSETTTPDGATGLRLRATQAVDELLLRLEPVNERQNSDVWVDASWAQTWFAGGMRQDRFVFRFRAAGPQVQVQLPAGAADMPLEILLDGALVSASRLPQGELAIALPAASESPDHTLELRVQRPERLAAWGEIDASFARLAGNRVQSPAYWQLVLPATEVALRTPRKLTAEYRIGWKDSRWGRQPTQSQEDLEHWTGAISAPGPAPSANVYLYSGFDLPERVTVAVARRVWVVAAVAAAALAIGLAWLHTTWGRSPTFWLAVGIVLAATMTAFPETALLMAQAVLFGGALTLLAFVTRRLVSQRREVTLAPAVPSSSIVSHTATTEQWVAEPRPNSSAAFASGSSYRPGGSSP